MSLRTLILWVIDLGIWYLFIYYWLYSIKNPVFLPTSAGLLLILLILGTVLCPMAPQDEILKKLRQKKK